MLKKTLQQYNKSRLMHTIEIHYLQLGKKETHDKKQTKKINPQYIFQFLPNTFLRK